MKKVLLVLVLLVGMVFMAGCESLQRMGKSWDSEFGGLERTVEVYSQDGQLIKTYEGKLDVQVNEYGNKVLFDLNGKRVIINNAVVVTEEK